MQALLENLFDLEDKIKLQLVKGRRCGPNTMQLSQRGVGLPSRSDISPLAPTHFLVVPKQHFASAAEVTPENEAVVGHIYTVIAKLAREMGFADGYRVVTNVGELAGQTVHHIHFHVLSGKQLGSFN